CGPEFHSRFRQRQSRLGRNAARCHETQPLLCLYLLDLQISRSRDNTQEFVNGIACPDLAFRQLETRPTTRRAPRSGSLWEPVCGVPNGQVPCDEASVGLRCCIALAAHLSWLDESGDNCGIPGFGTTPLLLLGALMTKPYTVGYLIGSLATRSINRKLATALVRLAPPELEMQEISFRDLPLYSYDFDTAFPPAATAFKETIAAVEAVLFITPEYNRSIPGALKNA